MEYKNTSSEKLFQSVYFLFFGYLIWWVTAKEAERGQKMNRTTFWPKSFGLQVGRGFSVASLLSKIND